MTVSGAANIKAVSKNGSYAWAAGIEAQDQAKMNFGKLTIATEAMAEDLAVLTASLPQATPKSKPAKHILT